MQRSCVMCGRAITVAVNRRNRRYSGGHYFGKMQLRWWQRKAEYWECEECYLED